MDVNKVLFKVIETGVHHYHFLLVQTAY